MEEVIYGEFHGVKAGDSVWHRGVTYTAIGDAECCGNDVWLVRGKVGGDVACDDSHTLTDGRDA